jgi:hypothetical protein
MEIKYLVYTAPITCKSVSPLVYSLEVFFIPEVVKIFSQINISVVLQSQIIQKLCMWIITIKR